MWGYDDIEEALDGIVSCHGLGVLGKVGADFVGYGFGRLASCFDIWEYHNSDITFEFAACGLGLYLVGSGVDVV